MFIHHCAHHVEDIALRASFHADSSTMHISFDGGAAFTIIEVEPDSLVQPDNGLPLDVDYAHKKIANLFVDWCESMTKRELLDNYIMPIAG